MQAPLRQLRLFRRRRRAAGDVLSGYTPHGRARRGRRDDLDLHRVRVREAHFHDGKRGAGLGRRVDRDRREVQSSQVLEDRGRDGDGPRSSQFKRRPALQEDLGRSQHERAVLRGEQERAHEPDAVGRRAVEADARRARRVRRDRRPERDARVRVALDLGQDALHDARQEVSNPEAAVDVRAAQAERRADGPAPASREDAPVQVRELRLEAL
mmetsp:Transcript_1335/g.3758  ORF Transcript_1335/g.3758 Transcript_1335/m.3758 type:complete len:212 (+) Transcript_1335:307-942(+)